MYANSHYNTVAYKQAPSIKTDLSVPPSLSAHSVAEQQVQICQAKMLHF